MLAQIESGAAERDAEPTPSFPEGPVALLERAGMLAWNAQPGSIPAVRGGGAPARPPGGERRWLGRPDLRRPPQCRRASRRSGPRAGPGPRARGDRRREAASGRVGRRPGPRGRAAGDRVRCRRDRCAAGREDVLLGRRRARPRADPGPPARRRATRSRCGSTSPTSAA